MPEVREGDLLAIMSAGAYGFVMASNYNSRPLPAEALVRGDKFALIRKRQTWEDLVREEVECTMVGTSRCGRPHGVSAPPLAIAPYHLRNFVLCINSAPAYE